MKALGMIEVKGFLGAISVADAALKAADVRLENAEIIKGGMTTVQLTGDVAAVEAAVEASIDIAKQLNCYITSHVIARLSEQTEAVLFEPKSEHDVNVELETPHDESIEIEVQKDAIAVEIADQVLDVSLPMERTLMNLKVSELRKKAYQMNLTTLKKSEIKYSNKATLIEAITKELERSEEA